MLKNFSKLSTAWKLSTWWATGDLDVWYGPSEQNYRQLLLAIYDFGFDTSGIKKVSSIRETGFIRLPIDPFYVELMSLIDGKMNFEDVYSRSFDFKVNQTKIKVIGYNDLIQTKSSQDEPKTWKI